MILDIMSKILVVGYGAIGKRHVKNILDYTNHEIIIFSKRKDLDELKKKNVKVFHTLEECISEKPEIGFITNETSYHIQIATKSVSYTHLRAHET